jgi:hypothetical protein
LLALREALRRSRPWTPSFVFMVIAVVALTPLLLTLLIVIGTGGTAEAASAQLDRRAPGFTPAVLFGVVAGAVLTGGFWWLTRSRRMMRAEIADLRRQIAALEAAGTGRHRTDAEPATVDVRQGPATVDVREGPAAVVDDRPSP